MRRTRGFASEDYRPGMGGKAKKVSFFLARAGRVYKVAAIAACDYSSGVSLRFSGCLSVNQVRKAMAALRPGNRFVNARKTLHFKIQSCFQKKSRIWSVK